MDQRLIALLLDCLHLFTEKYHALSLSRALADVWVQKNGWRRFSGLIARVFIPKINLAKNYALPPHSPILPFYYFVRAKDLLMRHGNHIRQLQQKDPGLSQLAERTHILNNWLIREGGSASVDSQIQVIDVWQ